MSAKLMLQPARVREQMVLNEQRTSGAAGALGIVWQRQQSKEMEWMRSLLRQLAADPHYIAAKAQVPLPVSIPSSLESSAVYT